MVAMTRRFPDGFVWGSATAALQIEGAAHEDGRGDSIWDVFCREHPEQIFERATPEIACDHYHRFAEDVEWMRRLGHTGYRLSISWPRLFPEGTGRANAPGFDFYDRLFDALAAARVEPNVTLYHWDLPQALAARGGWEDDDTIDRYVDYAAACFERFGDRVSLWSTLNEPSWSTLHGYLTGIHPPGRKDPATALRVSWALLRAHVRALRVARTASAHSRVGIALNLSPARPATASAADRAAARVADGILNRWFLDPVVLGRFPEDVLALYEGCGILPQMDAADLRLFAGAPVDFLGVNYYYPNSVSADAARTTFSLNNTGEPADKGAFALEGLFGFVANPRGRYTDWAWEIDPSGLEELLVRVEELRPGLALYVTENGIGLPDRLVEGRVDDTARIAFVAEHLEAVHRAIVKGANVRGYYMWSLLDNFSWVNGYKKRYGFLYVDRGSLERTPKTSATWFRDVARANGLPDAPGASGVQ
jgi:6-phospho-beta-glucosidase